jgi:hypothetical protein
MRTTIMETICNGNMLPVGTRLDFKAIEKTLQEYIGDKRYTLVRLAETNTSGLFIFQGIKYYWYISYDKDYDYDYINVDLA